jgi:glutathione S-transferase
MIIYGASFSPFVRKARVFAREKGLDVRLVSPRDDPEGFRAASPFGKIPALADGEFRVSDSSAIVTYFEALRPDPNLIPLDPRARAQVVWFDEFADTILQTCVAKIFFHRIAAQRFHGKPGDLAVADKAQARDFPKMADYLERSVPQSGYLVEDRYTLADIAVASALATLAQADCRLDPATYPKAAGYLAQILARPSFADLIDQETAELAA